VTQANPVVQVEQAVRTWPSVPTVTGTTVEAPVPEIKAPFEVMQEQGIAGVSPGTVTQESLVPVEART
jgi:hypothetical protein